jgi:hypothetical protein
MTDLAEFEAIKRLKYRYLRCLDLKLWDELAECLAPDVRATYADGRYAFEGRERVLEFLRTRLGPERITSHHVHQPEIELLAPDRARGCWALEDTVIDTQHGVTIHGAAFYEDEYRKVDGRWWIQATGYRRIFEELESRRDRPGLRLTANRFGAPG